MSESNTIIGINFGTAYTSIAYLNKVRTRAHEEDGGELCMLEIIGQTHGRAQHAG